MKYSKSESAYFRSSKKENLVKGGKLKEDGRLDKNNFNKNTINNHPVPIQRFKTKRKSNHNFEVKFSEMNPSHLNNSVKPIKIILQKITKEPYIFFGYNNYTRKYRYVLHNKLEIFTSKYRIKCNKLEDNGDIVELTHEQFLEIEIDQLIILFYHLLLIRKSNHKFMDKLFNYLNDYVIKRILQNHRSNIYTKLVSKISNMWFENVGRTSNSRGGKLDIDGKLDKDDFNLGKTQVIELNQFGENNYPKLSTRVRSNRGYSQNSQNIIVFPKEIRKKGFSNEPYIFFGYNQETNKYRYVSCNNPNIASKNPPVLFKELKDNEGIVELSLEDIKKISKEELLQLFCFLNKKSTNRGNGTQYMKRLQTYLLQEVRLVIPRNYDC
jgi:hypothetical protein